MPKEGGIRNPQQDRWKWWKRWNAQYPFCVRASFLIPSTSSICRVVLVRVGSVFFFRVGNVFLLCLLSHRHQRRRPCRRRHCRHCHRRSSCPPCRAGGLSESAASASRDDNKQSIDDVERAVTIVSALPVHDINIDNVAQDGTDSVTAFVGFLPVPFQSNIQPSPSSTSSPSQLSIVSLHLESTTQQSLPFHLYQHDEHVGWHSPQTTVTTVFLDDIVHHQANLPTAITGTRRRRQ